MKASEKSLHQSWLFSYGLPVTETACCKFNGRKRKRYCLPVGRLMLIECAALGVCGRLFQSLFDDILKGLTL